MEMRMAREREHQDKLALVLGGSRGIGAGIVERLAADGAQGVFTYSSSPDHADALVVRIAEGGGQAIAVKADSSDPAQISAAVDEAVARFGRLDILVVNAGILGRGTIDKITLEEFDRMVAVNVR